jgi:hypothetical protein
VLKFLNLTTAPAAPEADPMPEPAVSGGTDQDNALQLAIPQTSTDAEAAVVTALSVLQFHAPAALESVFSRIEEYSYRSDAVSPSLQSSLGANSPHAQAVLAVLDDIDGQFELDSDLFDALVSTDDEDGGI